MKPNKLLLMLAAVAALTLARPAPSSAQEPARPCAAGVKTTFVHLGNGEPGVLYEPVNPGPKAALAVFSMHTANDFLSHSSCTELSKRGYRVLCANDNNDKAGLFNDGILDKVLLQAKAGVIYLRKIPGVKKVVLWGHSGGGARSVSAYQDIAENGVKICQDAAKISKCPDTLAGLPPADGVVLGDSNWGLAAITLIGIDPAVGDDNAQKVNPDLDMFNPKNGFDPKGSHYSAAFVRKFEAAEGQRMNALIAKAQARLALIKAGKGNYAEDEPFWIAGASFTENKLYATDMALMAHTTKAWPLLHADGSITNEIVKSVRTPTLTDSPTKTMRSALKTTVTSFLSTYSVRVGPDYGYGEDDALQGVDWNSSWATVPGNAQGITVPFLTVGMTGSYESATAETIHNHLKSADKTLVYVEGASHGYPTCKRCEKTPGQYGDTVQTIYNYVDTWLSKPGRFF